MRRAEAPSERRGDRQYQAGRGTRRSSRRTDPCGVQRIRVREEIEKIKRMSVCENRRSNKEEHYGK